MGIVSEAQKISSSSGFIRGISQRLYQALSVSTPSNEPAGFVASIKGLNRSIKTSKQSLMRQNLWDEAQQVRRSLTEVKNTGRNRVAFTNPTLTGQDLTDTIYHEFIHLDIPGHVSGALRRASKQIAKTQKIRNQRWGSKSNLLEEVAAYSVEPSQLSIKDNPLMEKLYDQYEHVVDQAARSARTVQKSYLTGSNRPNKFSGFDDAYNKIEGLGHKGIGHRRRAAMTDFGSGYKRDPPIWLDIETGGIDPSKSSILSIASGQGKDIRSLYAAPRAGTFLSAFSEEKILPQLQGKSLLSEKQSIESLITQFEASPKAPIAGFNIKNFDLDFIQRRARVYGLENRFTKAARGRELIDPARRVKDIVANTISEHIEAGLFKEQLGGLSWAQAFEKWDPLPFRERPREYNTLAQLKGYLKSYERDTAMFKGWKLEDIHKLLPATTGISGAAHEAATDVLMTQRVTQAARSGELTRVLQTPAGATQWFDQVMARGPGGFQAEGRILSAVDVEKMAPPTESVFKSIVETVRKYPRVALGAGLAVAALSTFSSKDDNYNIIEGLPHGGFAQEGRLRLTDFGSGFIRAASMAERLGRVVKVGITESISSAMHISKEIVTDAIQHRSNIAQAIMGLTIVEAANVAESLLVSGPTAILAASVAASFGLVKIGYKATKHRAGLLGAANLARENPALAKTFLANAGSLSFQGVKNYVLHGGSSPAATFFDLGGGRLGRQAVLGDLELAIRNQPMNPVLSSRAAHNTIPGMDENGMASILRKYYDFGSPWQGLRNFISSFRGLAGAKEVKRLGTIEGWGQVFEMKGLFRGKNISFVRKQGLIGENEAKAHGAAARAGLAPRIIGSSKTTLDMRKLTGSSLEEMTGQEVEKILPMLHSAVQKLHKTGYSHGDLHLGNVFLDKGKIKFIDFGDAQKSNPLNLQKDLGDIMDSARAHIKFNSTPSRNNASNSMDGLGHKGIGHRFRKLFTPFGSKWDGLRNLVKGSETFEKMLASTGFKEALQAGKQLKILGSGGGGTAHLMSTTFRGKEFQFVRKVGDIGDHELAGLQKFGGSFAPSAYGSGEQAGARYLDMELIAGRDVHSAGITAREYSQVERNIEQMRKSGWSHGDVDPRNMVVTPEGQVSMIDWGLSSRVADQDAMIQLQMHVKPLLGQGQATTRHAERQLEAAELRKFRKMQQQNKKVAAARLQQSATATAWKQGIDAGKNSRS